MKGNFGGEDVINMILGNKKTAYHITRKIYRYYVNEEVKEEHVKELAEIYFANQYNTWCNFEKNYFLYPGSLTRKISDAK